jgi:hypothetical protein
MAKLMGDRSVTIGGGVVVLAIGLIGDGDKICQYPVALQYSDGSAAVATVYELVDSDQPVEIIKRFDGGDQGDNREAAVSHALEFAGYGRLESWDS